MFFYYILSYYYILFCILVYNKMCLYTINIYDENHNVLVAILLSILIIIILYI